MAGSGGTCRRDASGVRAIAELSVEADQPGRTVPGRRLDTPNGVIVLGYSNWPGRISVASSALYSRNLLTFLSTFWDKDRMAPNLPDTDDIVKGVMLTRGGAVVHPSFAPSQAA